jgi:hypothetical protein
VLAAARALDSTRAVASLIGAAITGIAQLRRRARPRPPVMVRAHLVRAGASSSLSRTGPLTPYELQTLDEDVRGMAGGSRLDVTLTDTCDDADVTRVRRQLGPLRRHGVSVHVARTHRVTP